jgi:hypothetical protein
LRRIIHEVFVGDEREWAVALANHSVGYRYSLDARKEECRFVWAENADFERSHVSWKSGARNEGSSLEVGFEVVESGTVAPDGTAKGGHEPGAVPGVQAVGEQDVLWRPVPLQPL